MEAIIKTDPNGIIKSYVIPKDEPCTSVLGLFKGYAIVKIKDGSKIEAGKTLLSDVKESD